MTHTITVAELLSDAGRDVRDKSLSNRGEIYDADEFRIMEIVPLDDGMFRIINRFGEARIVSGDYELYYEFYTPAPDPLALAEAALRSFLSWKEFFPNDILSGDGDIQMSAQVSTTGEPFKQAAAALAAIEAARKGE